MRRLTVYYAALAVVLLAIFVVAIGEGTSREAEPAVAGGYDVAEGAGCLGASAVLTQSGQYVDLTPADGTESHLRFRDGRLDGRVECTDGTVKAIDAEIADGRVTGTIGGAPVAAELKRDAPAPGTQAIAPAGLGGEWALLPRSDCLGGLVEIHEHGGGGRYELEGRRSSGELTYRDGEVTGDVRCADGTTQALEGTAVDRRIQLTLAPEGDEAAPVRHVAEARREFGHGLAAFFLAVAVVMLAARLGGLLITRIGQPRVMGEVLAGILLGPTLLGAIAPEAQAWLFPSDVVPWIGVAANLGLIFYMFLIGLEIDLSQLKGRIGQTAAISNTGVLVPMALGVAIAVPVYSLVGPPTEFLAFALFMGVSMSITAFPVLARILVERRMLKRPVGALALASAAIDDVSAWFLIAIASAVATAGSAGGVVRTIALAIAFTLGMVLLVRPVLARASVAYDEAGRVPSAWIVAIFAGVLLSAFATEEIGIALIFGAFIMGAVMPRHTGLTEDVTHRIEDFVGTLLLPLFFAYTGLKTDVLLIDRGALVALMLVLLAVACVCKFGGCFLAARVTGLGWRDSAVIGTLMNTRGLTELIVLNLALEKGVLSEALFAMLVVMALVTTFMTGPLLKLLDPRNELGAPVEEELIALPDAPEPVGAASSPERSILLAPHSDVALAHLRALAEPLARSVPPREVVLVRVVEPPASLALRGGLQTQNRLLAEANAAASETAAELRAGGVASRGVAIVSTDPGRDLSRLAQGEDVDLLLIDGRRPLLGEGVPRGDVGDVLREAPCDVAVLVARDDADVRPVAGSAIVVPFGGAEHDWAALETGAWLAASTGAELKLMGVPGDGDDPSSPSRMLASASLVVQQLVGVQTSPLIAEPGRGGLVAAAADARLLVVGLSDRWRTEGLGPTRSDIARHAPAPVLFVRRGTRAGALAPRDDMTRFTWSAPGFAPGEHSGAPIS